MTSKKEILKKRLGKLERHYGALKEYKALIDSMLIIHNIYDITIFNTLHVENE